MQDGGRLTGLRLGDYELRQLLGVGGMAEVYRGYDVVLQREVAVKVLAGSLASDRGYVERFRAEARRVAALNHPNVVPVYAAGEEHGSLYLVMPILNDSLRDLLDRERRVPFAEAVVLATQIASGLEAAHAIGLVHRDVKPENILVDAEGKALLTDFGIAREMARRGAGDTATLSATGLPVGTPEYMAPEQLRGLPLDARTDVYALGMVLYELLTGVLPFAGDTPYDIAVKVITAPLPPPSARNPAIPPELDRAVLRALARDPAQRHPTAAELAMALRHAMSRHATAAASTAVAAPAGASAHRAYNGAETTLGAMARAAERGARWFVQGWQAHPMVAGVLAVALLATTLGGVLLAQVHGPAGGTTARTGHPAPTVGATATATLAPPTATATVPLATRPPSLPLTIWPMSLQLSPSPKDSEICTATQTITNNTSQPIGWWWKTPAAPGFQFRVNNGRAISWPEDKTPGLAPGATDTIVATADCKSTTAYYVTVAASFGQSYNFVLSVAAPSPTQPSN